MPESAAFYDFRAHQWVPQCPHGDLCSGCDPAGHCSRMETSRGVPVSAEPTAASVSEREWIAGIVLMAELGALDEAGRESIIRSGRELLDRDHDHLDTVKQMLREGCSWTEIGRKIGWTPDAAERFYEAERLR